MLRSLAVASLTACLLACHGSTTPPGPYVTGTITSRAPWGGPGMLVDGGTGCGGPFVILVGPPPVYDSIGTALDTAALIVGRRVAVWVKGVIEESCPERMGAEKIVVRN